MPAPHNQSVLGHSESLARSFSPAKTTTLASDEVLFMRAPATLLSVEQACSSQYDAPSAPSGSAIAVRAALSATVTIDGLPRSASVSGFAIRN